MVGDEPETDLSFAQVSLTTSRMVKNLKRFEKAWFPVS
jgi:hypothetical protein